MPIKKILVVDDEPDILSVIKLELGSVGAEIFTANDGEKAIQISRNIKPDLVILDILLPGQDGTTIARALRDNPGTQDVPIIFLTGLLPRREQKKEHKTSGGDYMLGKPFDSAELIQLVKKLL